MGRAVFAVFVIFVVNAVPFYDRASKNYVSHRVSKPQSALIKPVCCASR